MHMQFGAKSYEPLTWLLNSLKECPFLCPFLSPSLSLSLSLDLSPFLSSFFEFFSFFQSFFIYSFFKKMKLSQLRDSVNTQEKTSTNTLITIGLKKSLTKIEFVKIPMTKLKGQNLILTVLFLGVVVHYPISTRNLFPQSSP